MRFTAEQIEQFRTEGYLAVPNFWTNEEIQAMRAELERLKENGLLRNVATDGDGKTHSATKANLQLCPMAPHSTFFRAMPFAPKVIEAVSSLLGDPVLLHLDQAYFAVDDPLKGTALWTAVHDATLANGTMRVIPRVFSTALPHDRDPESDHHIRCWPDEAQAVPIEIPAGGALFFCYGTPHATGANTTDYERAGVALHFLNAAVDGTARGGFPLGKRPPLTGPDTTGGENEYGVRVAGTWNAEVARALS
jgi:phytanoyl-CoA hydroxylase